MSDSSSSSSAPMKPFWVQPSHPDIQEVQFATEGFFTKSFSKVALPPFGLFAKMSYPPCTPADKPTYATVQCGANEHLNLNSDLVYINHSCSPSLIFDMSSNSILAGPSGLHPGQELTFFYPSTEWSMAQGFDCFCGSPSCRGFISGAGKMSSKQLEGVWLNSWIRLGVEKRDAAAAGDGSANGEVVNGTVGGVNGIKQKIPFVEGRNGVTSRELSGEMGGDTLTAA